MSDINYIDLHCDKGLHSFARDGEGAIQAYHLDGDNYQLCVGAEFNLSDLLNGDVPTMHNCPWCDANVTDTEHIRKCSGYHTQPTINEIVDAYSDPTDGAKRDAMLANHNG